MLKDSLHDISYQLSADNGLIFLFIGGAVAVVVALIILFDPFKRRHKEYRYPWERRRFSFRFNPFGFLFRRARGMHRSFNQEIERRQQHKSHHRE